MAVYETTSNDLTEFLISYYASILCRLQKRQWGGRANDRVGMYCTGLGVGQASEQCNICIGISLHALQCPVSRRINEWRASNRVGTRKMLYGRRRGAYGRVHVICESDFISVLACRFVVVIENLMTSKYFRPKMQADLMSVDSEARTVSDRWQSN